MRSRSAKNLPTSPADSQRVKRAKPRQSGAQVAPLGKLEDDNQIVQALARGLDILGSFRRSDRQLGNAELASRTGLSLPTVSRLTYTLALRGYLGFDQRHREYKLGPQAAILGSLALVTNNVRSLALPLMRELATGSCYNIGLGTPGGLQMVYTDACEGDALIALRLNAGSRLPMATSAMGRAYLATRNAEERRVLLEQIEPQYGVEWPTIYRGVETAVDEIKNSGFCLSIGDWQKDINGVAVPIQSVDEPDYVLNLGGPAYLLPEEELRTKLGPRLLLVAKMIQDQITLRE